MSVPVPGAAPRQRRMPLIILIALLGVSAVQVLWWMYDQAKFSAAVEAQIVQLATSGTTVDPAIIEQARAEHTSRRNQYAWEGAFFLLVLTACMIALWRSLRSEFAIRRKQETFLALVSHQFKTPLASLRLAVETLAMRRATAEHSERLVGRALDDVQRLEDLVENILESARLDEGRVTLRREALPLARVVAQTANRLAERAERQRVRLAIDVPAQAAVLADPVAADAVLRNVLENAIASVIPMGGGTVSVSAIEKGDRIELAIADTGVGFDPADAPKLFEKFGFTELAYRAGERTGLGLYIVRRLMELGAGEVRAESEGLGRGARFILAWPRACEDGS
jgi:signal transduction histidine kinase